MQRIDNYCITFLLGIFWLLITPSWQIPKSLCFMNRKFLISKINIWWYSWEWRLIKHHILFTLVNFIDCQILNLCTCIFLCFIPIDFIIIICNIFITHIRKKKLLVMSFRVHIFLSYKYLYVSFCRLIFAAFQINYFKKWNIYICYNTSTCLGNSFSVKL